MSKDNSNKDIKKKINNNTNTTTIKKKRKVGRPSIYHTRVKPHLETVRMMRQSGYAMEQIADYLNINISTLYKFQDENIELKEALRIGTNELVLELEEALYNLASGKTTKTVKITRYNKDGSTTEELREEQIEPNARALEFALKNIARDKFKDKWEIEVNVDEPVPSFSQLIKSQRAERLKEKENEKAEK